MVFGANKTCVAFSDLNLIKYAIIAVTTKSETF
jgi:hypothetical protein